MTEIVLGQIMNYIKNSEHSLQELLELKIKEVNKGDSIELPIDRYVGVDTQVYFSTKESYIILTNLDFCLLDLVIKEIDLTASNLRERYVELLQNLRDKKELNTKTITESYGEGLYPVLSWVYEYCKKPVYTLLHDDFHKELNIVIDMQELHKED